MLNQRRRHGNHHGHQEEETADLQHPADAFAEDAVPLVVAGRAVDEAENDQHHRQMPIDVHGKQRKHSIEPQAVGGGGLAGAGVGAGFLA